MGKDDLFENDLYDFGFSKSKNKIANRLFFEAMRKINTPCDFNYWTKIKLWTVDEASVICLGLEPRIFLGMESLYFYRSDKKKLIDEQFLIFQKISETTNKRVLIFDNIERAYIEKEINVITMKDIAYINSIDFCNLCIQRNIDIPKELIDFSKHNISADVLWKNAFANEKDIMTMKILYAYYHRAIGKSWKEIAAHFNVTERTAMRWVENGAGDTARLAKGLPEIFPS